MRVAVVGDLGARRDEGLKNVARSIAKGLSVRNDVHRADLGKLRDGSFWRELRAFSPDIVHYVPGNTAKGMVLAKLLRQRVKAPLVLSCIHDGHWDALRGEGSWFARRLLRATRADMALVQSEAAEGEFQRAGWRTARVPNGVDLERFAPQNAAAREAIRAKLGVGPDDTMVLHVGHLIPQRNLDALVPMVSDTVKVHIVASTYQGVTGGLKERLEAAGCTVHVGYHDRIQDKYAAADAYVFPVARGATILMPLSVLEAMATNVATLSVPHEGLRMFLRDGDGLAFCEPDEMRARLRAMRGRDAATRAKVTSLGWDAVVARIEACYGQVLEGVAP